MSTVEGMDGSGSPAPSAPPAPSATPWSELENSYRGPRVEHLTRLDATTTPFQSLENMWKHPQYRDALLADPEWGSKFRDMMLENDLSQDDLPGQISFMSDIVRPNRRRLIGDMLMRTVDVTVPTTQWPVLEDAEATESARGQQNFTSGGAGIEYIDLKLQHTINAYDRMDQEHREDMQPSVVPAYWESLAYAHDKLLDSKYVGTITGVGHSNTGRGSYTDPSGNTHRKTAFRHTTAANTGGTYDDFARAHGMCDQREFDPDCILVHTSTHTEMLLWDEFKNADYFQADADWKRGMIPMLLDCMVYRSNAVPAPGAGKPLAWFFSKSEFAICARRRDRLITRDRDPVTLSDRMAISTRNGYAIKDPNKCLVLVQKT